MSLSQISEPIRPDKLSEPPVIDGVLDENIWNESTGISRFISFIPDFGKELSFETIV